MVAFEDGIIRTYDVRYYTTLRGAMESVGSIGPFMIPFTSREFETLHSCIYPIVPTNGSDATSQVPYVSTELVEFIGCDVYRYMSRGTSVMLWAEGAVEEDNVEALQYFHAKHDMRMNAILRYAIRFGSPLCVKYLLDHIPQKDRDALYMKWVPVPGSEEEELVKHPTGAFATAVRSGSVETVKILLDSGFAACDDACLVAVMADRFTVLKWLYDNGWSLDPNSCFAAAGRGNMEILQWLLSVGCGWGEGSLDVIADYVDLSLDGDVGPMEKWLLDNGCPWDRCLVADPWRNHASQEQSDGAY